MFHRLALALVKVIAPKLVIGFTAREDMVDDDKDGVAESHQSLLGPASSGKAMILGREVGVFGTGGAVGCLDEHLAQWSQSGPSGTASG
jgi:hypothetical protein